ncbi:MAG: hypothetical protein ABI595_10215 [Actinomycetota bacterium]
MSSPRPAIDDPGDWYNRWITLHPSPLFARQFAGLALTHIGETPDGIGSEVVRYVEDDGTSIEVEVAYFLETFPEGRVFHVLSILSPGDPQPPFVD